MRQTFFLGFAVVVLIAGAALAQQQDVTPPQQSTTDPSAGQARQTDQTGTADQRANADTGAETAESLIEDAEPVEIRYDRYNAATLRALDKITGRSTDIDVTADKPVVFGSLRVTLKSCHQTPPELPPEAAAFLEVDSVQAVQASLASQTAETDVTDDDAERLFSGWMFASSPGLSALEHPVYDIWTIRCTTVSPVAGASGG